jgi:hypothetical protein
MARRLGSILLGMLALLSLALVTGCRPDDTTPPELSVVVNGRLPWERVEVSAGEALTITADARDDRALNEIRIRVRPAEGEPFEHPTAEGWVLPTGDWNWSASGGADGKQRVWSQSRDIPIDQRGRWVVEVEAIDVAGNGSELLVFQVDITNDQLPRFEFTAINQADPQLWTSVPEWIAGSAVPLEGMVSDSDGLGALSLTLYDETGAMVWSWNDDAEGAVLYDLSGLMIELPAALTGMVSLRCRAEDALGLIGETGFGAVIL